MPSSLSDRIARDFQRDVHCLFGLPVDNLTLASAKALLRERTAQEGNTVLATINVNWVVQSFSDPEFRAAILNSDLVTLDGKPLLWLAKLLGCPMRETVPGSTLIQELLEEQTDHPLTIFLFGGEGQAAELAMERINQRKGGLRAVGALNPGFGSVDEMSSESIIATINATNPDILLVALGAKKGTQWIEHNRDRLNAKITSHLGATINFLAGTVQRAPRLMQDYGMEWIWRIMQEPKIFSRYATDGWALLRFLLPRVPLWVQYVHLLKQFRHTALDTDISVQEHPNEIQFSFGKNPQLTGKFQLRQVLSKNTISEKKIIFDFQKTEFADVGFLGLLLLFLNHRKKAGNEFELRNCNKVTSIFQLCGFSKPEFLMEKINRAQ